jgi:hypothetical protein
MRLSECPPLHREFREDREEDSGRLNVLLPQPHHQHSEPRVTPIDGINVSPGAANTLHQLHADSELTAFKFRVSSLRVSLGVATHFPQSFEIGRRDARYRFPWGEPKLSLDLVHREEPPKLGGK